MWDISGALGDIGVLFPLAIALISRNGFNPTALFLMAGLFYLASAYYFKVTMPVQPLKAMSAIAIATGLNVEVINAAGVALAILLIFIAISGLSEKVGRVFDLSIIRGIQLGLGLMLMKTSLDLVNGDLWIALVTGGFLLTFGLVVRKIPALFPILVLGLILAWPEGRLTVNGPLALTPKIPGMDSLWSGFWVLVLPQITLTFGNAIVATEATAKMLYGPRAKRLNLRNLPLSMGLANLASGLIGGAPMCHGSGGVTAHCKFGATTQRSGYIIGLTLMGFALLFGDTVLSIMISFPKGILGALLGYVGIQHSLFIQDIRKDRAAMGIALAVALVGVLTNNLTIGFMTGLGIRYTLTAIRKAVIRPETI